MEERKYESKKENLIPALGNSHDTGYAAHDGHAGICGGCHPDQNLGRHRNANLLMEVNGDPPYVLAERLIIRDEVKKVNPDCKIVLVVDENSEKEVAAQVRQAKKDGRIDQFIYGSISANYLVALMDTL